MIYVIGLDNVVKGVLNNDSPKAVPFWEDVNTEAIADGLDVFEFKCPADADATSGLVGENYVATTDSDGNLKMFKIREVQTHHNNEGLLYKHVFAESVALELLKTVLRPRTFSGQPPLAVLTSVLDNTLWKPGTIEVTELLTLELNEYPNLIEVILNIARESGAEVRYRVEINNGRVTGRFVDLLKNRGQVTGKRFTYTKDVQSVIRTEDTSELFTAIVPLGPEKNGQPITIESLSGSFTNDEGTTFLKPMGTDFIGDPDALSRWSDDGQHLTGVLRLEDSAPNIIMQKGWEYLRKHTYPKMKYEVDVALLDQIVGGGYTHEKVRLGDTLIVEDLLFDPPLVLQARVIEHSRSKADPYSDSVVLGNFVELEISADAMLIDLLNKVRQSEADWLAGENIHQAPTPPDFPVEGQLWIDTTTEPNVLKRWDGTSWIKATPTVAIEVGAETPVGAQDKADIAALKAERISNLDARMRLNYQVPKLVAMEHVLPTTKDDINAKFATYTTDDNAMDSAITNAIFDNTIDATEKSNLETLRAARLASIQALLEVVELAERQSIDNALESVLADAQTFTESYANKKITQSVTAPIAPTTNDLWIDITTTPYVWKRWNGTAWEKAIPTDMQELSGSITSTQITDGAITAPKIGANVITSNMISTTGLDAGVIKFGTMSGSRIVASSITSDKLSVSSLSAITANLGTVTAGTITGVSITGGSITSSTTIDVGTSMKIGQNIYLQYSYADRFNEKGIVFYDNVYGDGYDTRIVGTYLKMDIKSRNVNVYSDLFDIMSTTVRQWNGSTMYFNGGQPQSSRTETGFCGVGGISGAGSSACAGVGVNYHLQKTYTPSSISMTSESSNSTALVINITNNGFWIYVNSDGSTNFKYWRGRYFG